MTKNTDLQVASTVFWNSVKQDLDINFLRMIILTSQPHRHSWYFQQFSETISLIITLMQLLVEDNNGNVKVAIVGKTSYEYGESPNIDGLAAAFQLRCFVCMYPC